ncbi:hypothetical protein [Sphingomonas sp. RIT328]|uniref:hypothetical protein n=1 Tax=Sphingomonas sp. RIT328 TaxID=1470591 RepID=UPI0004457A02|nr:hypothetical protein [Sphingomonas sp. RIT328]EZP57252.1 hypothetical protein BW41_00095 [Sphingomonas sp. RIT328]
MQGNLDPSSRTAIAGVIPAQQANVGTVTSDWVDMRSFFALLAALNVGVIGAAGTIDVKIEQATSNAGAGAKPVGNLATAQIVKAGGDNRQAAINVRQEDLDKNNGFRFVRLSVTVGGAASFLSAMLVGFDARYGAGAANQINTVAQTVS